MNGVISADATRPGKLRSRDYQNAKAKADELDQELRRQRVPEQHEARLIGLLRRLQSSVANIQLCNLEAGVDAESL
jgi:hypothetical protein